jgi:hypothetical protein
MSLWDVHTDKLSRQGLAGRRLMILVRIRWTKRTITRMLTGQTDGTDETDVDDIFVTEACCAEIDLVLSGYGDDLANGRRRQKGHLWLD